MKKLAIIAGLAFLALWYLRARNKPKNLEANKQEAEAYQKLGANATNRQLASLVPWFSSVPILPEEWDIKMFGLPKNN